MFDLLATATAVIAEFAWVIPVTCGLLMVWRIVVRGEPEPPKDGRR